MRLTVAARQEAAEKLVAGGMSQRKVAKVLGVDHKTIAKDLGKNSPKSGEKFPSRTGSTATKMCDLVVVDHRSSRDRCHRSPPSDSGAVLSLANGMVMRRLRDTRLNSPSAEARTLVPDGAWTLTLRSAEPVICWMACCAMLPS